ncbi:MAG: hypothetical protein EA342_16515 [Leptolyngbya sp. LCM1.Bin17]|nr:MAG: hypothetical protein EA342_16515 [Leptolyngbya sp. LCM1.Bin17]
MKMSLSPKQSGLGSALMAGAIVGLAVIAHPGRAEFSIAYCDGAAFATNIYRAGDPESPSSDLTMRIFSRADGVVFLNTLANRAPNPEGYAYSNIYGENQWELFIPNSESLQCTLSRDGTVIDNGTVTMRELPSGD